MSQSKEIFPHVIEDDKFYRQLSIKLEEIAQCVMDYCGQTPAKKEYGLYNGESGLSLFLFYFAEYANDKKIKNQAIEVLYSVFRDMNTRDTIDLSYCQGLTGVYALLYHLLKQGFIDSNLFYFDSDIEKAIIREVYAGIDTRNYDFLYGVTGYLFFLFLKYECTKSSNDLKLISNIIETIYQKIRQDELHFAFFQNVQGKVNIGLAHGVSGLLLVLSHIYKSGIKHQNLYALMDNIITFLMPFTRRKNDCLSYFPYAYEINKEADCNSRLGWCYGDIGSAQALMQYASIIQDKKKYDDSMSILLNTTKRKDLEKNKIFDGGLCHGSAGIAVIYNRLHRDTSNKAYKNYSDYWYLTTLKFAEYEHGYAGFCSAKNSDGVYVYEKDISLLNGVVGIGLAIISKLSNVLCNWEELFLIN